MAKYVVCHPSRAEIVRAAVEGLELETAPPVRPNASCPVDSVFMLDDEQFLTGDPEAWQRDAEARETIPQAFDRLAREYGA